MALKVPPMSAARREGDLVFTSGQIGIDRATGEAPADFEAQTRLAFDNLRSALEGAGSSLDRVLRLLFFVVRREDLATLNQIYEETFQDPFPARSTFICELVSDQLLVEIEAISRQFEARLRD